MSLEKNVQKVINDVKSNKDKAVRKYTKKFDGKKIDDFLVKKKKIKKSYKYVKKDFIKSVKVSIRNVRKFAKLQYSQYKPFETEIQDNVFVGQTVTPIQKAGLYIPGGKYPLFSSLIMMMVPAKVAGVKDIVICSPPEIDPRILVVADLIGADKIFSIGGIQAISAMAFGTETVPRVNKIFGPGNKYVTEAKRQLFGKVGVDKIAGPSEILILADKNANPKFIASDLLAQAEHDENAKPILVTTSMKIASMTKKEIKRQLKGLSTSKIAEKSWKNNGKVIVVKNIEKAFKKINSIAPEHLEIQTRNPKKYMKNVKNYGSLFLGFFSAEVFGDYVSGTNHVLPTNGAAKYSDGLSVRDFLKIQTYQYINKNAPKEIYDAAEKMAEKEGLYAHKNAAKIRRE